MRQRQYYSANINGLKVANLDPLRFEHVTLRKNVIYYQGLFGRMITVENGNPTNTLEEATDWLTGHAKRHPDINLLKKEGPVPYLDTSTLHSIDVTEEEAKKLELKRKQNRKRS